MPTIAQRIQRITAVEITGSVVSTNGLCATVTGFPAPLGSTCEIQTSIGKSVIGEVVRFQNHDTFVMPYTNAVINRGAQVRLLRTLPMVSVGNELIGRVIDSQGQVIDGQAEPHLPQAVYIGDSKPIPLTRPAIDQPVVTGIRAIDGPITCGFGQRLAICGGSSYERKNLIGRLASGSSSDVNVIVLITERERDVRQFLDRELSTTGLNNSIVIAATADEPAVSRLRAIRLGTAIAEFFRDAGRDVALFVDSMTVAANAQRDIGLATGESIARHGYSASVFSVIPKLIEQTISSDRGRITSFYSVHDESEQDPVNQLLFSILDGRIVLSRELEDRKHHPAIDIAASFSRDMADITNDAQQQLASKLRELVERLRNQRDRSASDEESLARLADLNEFLQQRPAEYCSMDETLRRLNHAVTGSIANPLSKD